MGKLILRITTECGDSYEYCGHDDGQAVYQIVLLFYVTVWINLSLSITSTGFSVQQDPGGC